MLSRTQIIALVVAAILALSLIILYSSNFSERQNYQIKIREFSSGEGWFCPAGVSMVIIFDVYIENNGTQDVTDLTLLIKRTELTNDTFRSIQTLNASSGETVHASAEIDTNIEQYSREFYNSTFTATVSLDSVVLDEKTIEITKRQF